MGLALWNVLQISKKVGGAATVDCAADEQTGGWGWHWILAQTSKQVGGAGTVDCTAD